MDPSPLLQPQVAAILPPTLVILICAATVAASIVLATSWFGSSIQKMINVSAKTHEEADAARHEAIKARFTEIQRDLKEFAGRFRDLEMRTSRIEGKIGIFDPVRTVED